MNTASEVKSGQQITASDLLELTSLLDELNRHYGIVDVPQKMDEQKEHKGESG